MLSLGMEAFRGRCRGLIRVFVVGFGVYALLFEVIRFRFRSFGCWALGSGLQGFLADDVEVWSSGSGVCPLAV